MRWVNFCIASLLAVFVFGFSQPVLGQANEIPTASGCAFPNIVGVLSPKKAAEVRAKLNRELSKFGFIQAGQGQRVPVRWFFDLPFRSTVSVMKKKRAAPVADTAVLTKILAFSPSCHVITSFSENSRSKQPVIKDYDVTISFKKNDAAQTEDLGTFFKGAPGTIFSRPGIYTLSAKPRGRISPFKLGTITHTVRVDSPALKRPFGIVQLKVKNPGKVPGTAFSIGQKRGAETDAKRHCRIYKFPAVIRVGEVITETGSTIQSRKQKESPYPRAKWELFQKGKLVETAGPSINFPFDAEKYGNGNYELFARLSPEDQGPGPNNFQVNPTRHVITVFRCEEKKDKPELPKGTAAKDKLKLPEDGGENPEPEEGDIAIKTLGEDNAIIIEGVLNPDRFLKKVPGPKVAPPDFGTCLQCKREIARREAVRAKSCGPLVTDMDRLIQNAPLYNDIEAAIELFVELQILTPIQKLRNGQFDVHQRMEVVLKEAAQLGVLIDRQGQGILQNGLKQANLRDAARRRKQGENALSSGLLLGRDISEEDAPRVFTFYDSLQVERRDRLKALYTKINTRFNNERNNANVAIDAFIAGPMVDANEKIAEMEALLAQLKEKHEDKQATIKAKFQSRSHEHCLGTPSGQQSVVADTDVAANFTEADGIPGVNVLLPDHESRVFSAKKIRAMAEVPHPIDVTYKGLENFFPIRFKLDGARHMDQQEEIMDLIEINDRAQSAARRDDFGRGVVGFFEGANDIFINNATLGLFLQEDADEARKIRDDAIVAGLQVVDILTGTSLATGDNKVDQSQKLSALNIGNAPGIIFEAVVEELDSIAVAVGDTIGVVGPEKTNDSFERAAQFEETRDTIDKAGRGTNAAVVLLADVAGAGVVKIGVNVIKFGKRTVSSIDELVGLANKRRKKSGRPPLSEIQINKLKEAQEVAKKAGSITDAIRIKQRAERAAAELARRADLQDIKKSVDEGVPVKEQVISSLNEQVAGLGDEIKNLFGRNGSPDVDAPDVNAPKQNAPKPNRPRVDGPEADSPKVDVPKIEANAPEVKPKPKVQDKISPDAKKNKKPGGVQDNQPNAGKDKKLNADKDNKPKADKDNKPDPEKDAKQKIADQRKKAADERKKARLANQRRRRAEADAIAKKKKAEAEQAKQQAAKAQIDADAKKRAAKAALDDAIEQIQATNRMRNGNLDKIGELNEKARENAVRKAAAEKRLAQTNKDLDGLKKGVKEDRDRLRERANEAVKTPPAKNADALKPFVKADVSFDGKGGNTLKNVRDIADVVGEGAEDRIKKIQEFLRVRTSGRDIAPNLKDKFEKLKKDAGLISEDGNTALVFEHPGNPKKVIKIPLRKASGNPLEKKRNFNLSDQIKNVNDRVKGAKNAQKAGLDSFGIEEVGKIGVKNQKGVIQETPFVVADRFPDKVVELKGLLNKTGGNLSLEDAVEALRPLHVGAKNGKVFGDLNPGNVVKVTDEFGFSRGKLGEVANIADVKDPKKAREFALKLQFGSAQTAEGGVKQFDDVIKEVFGKDKSNRDFFEDVGGKGVFETVAPEGKDFDFDGKKVNLKELFKDEAKFDEFLKEFDEARVNKFVEDNALVQKQDALIDKLKTDNDLLNQELGELDNFARKAAQEIADLEQEINGALKQSKDAANKAAKTRDEATILSKQADDAAINASKKTNDALVAEKTRDFLPNPANDNLLNQGAPVRPTNAVPNVPDVDKVGVSPEIVSRLDDAARRAAKRADELRARDAKNLPLDETGKVIDRDDLTPTIDLTAKLKNTLDSDKFGAGQTTTAFKNNPADPNSDALKAFEKLTPEQADLVVGDQVQGAKRLANAGVSFLDIKGTGKVTFTKDGVKRTNKFLLQKQLPKDARVVEVLEEAAGRSGKFDGILSRDQQIAILEQYNKMVEKGLINLDGNTGNVFVRGDGPNARAGFIETGSIELVGTSPEAIAAARKAMLVRMFGTGNRQVNLFNTARALNKGGPSGKALTDKISAGKAAISGQGGQGAFKQLIDADLQEKFANGADFEKLLDERAIQKTAGNIGSPAVKIAPKQLSNETKRAFVKAKAIKDLAKSARRELLKEKLPASPRGDVANTPTPVLVRGVNLRDKFFVDAAKQNIAKLESQKLARNLQKAKAAGASQTSIKTLRAKQITALRTFSKQAEKASLSRNELVTFFKKQSPAVPKVNSDLLDDVTKGLMRKSRQRGITNFTNDNDPPTAGPARLVVNQ